MDKEFIPYAESLELKKLGFDEPCFGHWNQNTSEITYWADKEMQNERTNKWILGRLRDRHIRRFDLEQHYPTMSKRGCAVPLYQQAFRWFRKKYNLHPAIYPIKQHWECDIRHTNKDTNSSIFSWDNEFEYEEAELACLRKLIEIVKKK